MKKVLVVLTFLAIFGCARVTVETPKDPIKVDISMRIDVYKHAVQEAESIEDQIFGVDKGKKQLNRLLGIDKAYAQDYSPQVQEAISRRKMRQELIDTFCQKGYIGENKEAELEIIADDLDADLKQKITVLLNEENADRGIIYKSSADKVGTDLPQMRKVFFTDHYKRAPQGYWFQVYDQAAGAYIWKQK